MTTLTRPLAFQSAPCYITKITGVTIMLQISLAPDGSVRLHLPSSRTLDLQPVPEAIAILQRLLLAHGEPSAPYEERYPTQVLLDRWLKNLSVVREEPEVPIRQRRPKPSAKRLKTAAKQAMNLDYDLSSLEFTL